ncbi:hypothetical protein LIER_42592 [Lithospermum erythrorhizon]|uniref:Transposase n=1 Tax=Lithospermum erythrorhizon TaxID=34254 RepID=A0AAV3NPJ6_LITER
MSLPWIVCNKTLGHVIHEDLEFMYTEDLDLRTVDELALRVGQPLGSEVVYVYSVHGWGLTWLKPFMCDSDVDAFRKFALEGSFFNIYVNACPTNEFITLFCKGIGLRTILPQVEGNGFRVADLKGTILENGCLDVLCLLNRRYYKANTKNNVDGDDVIQYDDEGGDIPNAEEMVEYYDDLAFFKEWDTFDDDLDNEIRLENINIERRKAEKLEIIAKRSMKRMRSEGFKERKTSGYKESSSDEEKDNHVLSENDSNCTLRTITTSGLVFSSKEQVTEAVTWYSIFHQKPLWLGANDNCRLSVKCGYLCNFSIWFAKDYMLGETDWSVRKVNSRHNGCPDLPIALCNNNFLAKALEGIRLLPHSTQVAIMVFENEMFKIKISKHCARRTKEKALKKINGDDLE